VRSRLGGKIRSAAPGERYVFGLDLGKAHDFTVLIGFEARSREMVYFHRFRQLSYSAQKEFIVRAVRDYGGRLVMDSTGVGEPIYDDFRRAGVDVAGYRFTEESKRRLIENLIVEMEAGRVRLADAGQLVAELEAFRYVVNRSGRLSYEGPSGGHDDCVIALALAVWGLRGWRAGAQCVVRTGTNMFGAGGGRMF